MRTLAVLAAASVAAAWLGASPVSAGQGYSGNNDYQMFCSSCHGSTAKGDGPIAKSLSKRPPDLTQLTIRNNGVFPEERATKAIDGHSASGNRGNADMPVWSDVFAKSQESLGAEAAQTRITALVHYLASIQEKP